ncbi:MULTISPECIES: succinate dehydrogenase, hydrophobic membrane anchor protein [Thioclava]|uniref:Succinate dehydrogenase, hydrophobic membrane anchor protein n=1 Tax=Thioclava electrotropha TaxID=1549850 RepID=A0ABX6YRQ9_9RHOB|nr:MULTISPECIES: succinate dehydrogenase, hydrophobic membrane anchor protein [Thioclava]MAQ37292.1 succinate dehydrogenase [Thioclava sp.]MPQ92426.1 succinate dehydrogenase, hydrophobic membrane anchor protein [Thioclava sp. JE_KL1]OOY10541.1 succinate dehydrogenase [Thioclava sp. F36-7]OOY17997.1 succinate dehydrogenase [Thioclava sp. DLFJ4-1]OOY21644.1 succinate dehydrogenase [Thioclava sp. DLFJ5-1]|tara:strand:+ start:1967 stop:2359 length:393 start_codon:yes stop_codon:yes gene_type:complete
MRYLTDRKRAVGKGASGTGPEHHWWMSASAVALAFMIPTWLYIVGTTLGADQQTVITTFSQPFPAILTALVVIVGMRHFAKGTEIWIEDYIHGTAAKATKIAMHSLAYVIMATALYALGKMVFIGLLLGN